MWHIAFKPNFVISFLYAISALTLASSVQAASLVLIESNPDSAKVIVDGSFYGRTPIKLKLSPGTYQLELTKQKYKNYHKKITIGQVDRSQRIQATLESEHANKVVGGLKIQSKPTGANIYIDGKYQDKTPLRIDLSPGTYDIRIEKKGYSSIQNQFDVKANMVLKFVVTMEELAQKGTLSVITKPAGANIYVNDEYYDTSPARVNLSKGTVNLRLEKGGYQTVNKNVEIRASKEIPVNITLEPVQSYSSVEFVSSPKGAKVFIDDEFYETTPFKVRLLTGSHTVKLKKRGYKTSEESFYVDGSSQTISKMFDLQRNAPVYGTLRAYSVPNEADVFLGDQNLGVTPLDTKLEPGNYQLVFRSPGYEPRTENVTIYGQQVQNIQAILQESDRSTEFGGAQIDADQKAQVFIDGEYAGETPVYARLPVDEHHIEVRKKGFETFQQKIHVKSGKTQEVYANLVNPKDAEPVSIKYRINSDPLNSKILLNNNVIGNTPLNIELEAGTYALEIHQTGYEVYRKQVVVSSEATGSEQTINARLKWKGSDKERILRTLLDKIL